MCIQLAIINIVAYYAKEQTKKKEKKKIFIDNFIRETFSVNIFCSHS